MTQQAAARPRPAATQRPGRVDAALVRLGLWLQRNQRAIRRLQWAMILVYAALIVGPALRPLPDHTARIVTDVTRFAQFLFWGIWWPFVLLSVALLGRAWCGFLCPEGALSEIASQRARGRRLPRWITWPGWPFAAFALTTVYGQLVSVYQYPRPALLVLGGSTLVAVAVGLAFGRGKRVWCRYLCPVNGVFGMLSKLSPLHFHVDEAAWRRSQQARERPAPVTCAPMVPLRTMQGSRACHMCGRCAGFRGAIELRRRAPASEIVAPARARADRWQTLLIVFGMLALAPGAFQWSLSPLWIAAKQTVAVWLVRAGVLWPLETEAPWWLLTHYPQKNDVLTLLDGGLILGWIAAVTLAQGGLILLALAAATRLLGRWSWARLHHLAQCLIPLAGAGLFTGLSMLTTSQLAADGIRLLWADGARMTLLALAGLWSLMLAWRVSGHHAAAPLRRLAAAAALLPVAAGIVLEWHLLLVG